NTFVNNTIVDNDKGIFHQKITNNNNIFSLNVFDNIINADYADQTSWNYYNQSTLGNYWSDWTDNEGYNTIYYAGNSQNWAPPLGVSQIDYHPLQCMQDSHCQQQTFCDGNNVVQGSGTC